MSASPADATLAYEPAARDTPLDIRGLAALVDVPPGSPGSEPSDAQTTGGGGEGNPSPDRPADTGDQPRSDTTKVESVSTRDMKLEIGVTPPAGSEADALGVKVNLGDSAKLCMPTTALSQDFKAGASSPRYSPRPRDDGPRDGNLRISAAGGTVPAKRTSAYPGRAEPDLKLEKKQTMKQRLKASDFYHGQTASKVRACVHGKTFVLFMSLALLIALFLPEIWVLSGVNSNIEVDVILTMVMAAFVFEFVCLSTLDATYFLSFFFFMDICGTLSMMFDISYMIGEDHTSVQLFSGGDSDAKQSLMLLRAARAARVGARAGRLSRVLRILRFLPFLSAARDDKATGVAASISRQLANLLATRVAALTIILVMVIPCFDILSFPQTDHSLQTWVERLSASLDEKPVGHLAGLGTKAFHREVAAMVAMFEPRSYGPYMACKGSIVGGEWKCREATIATFTHEAPGRSASALWVHTETYMVGFNMHETQQLEKGLAMVNITFIISIMIFSGLALSNVVTELAVRPLERMLKTVRDIAGTVFSMSSTLGDEEEDEGEEFDINTSTEMKLLEKVVAKLAIIADLQSGHGGPHIDEGDMGEEDIGILNMMQGKDVVLDGKKQAQRRVSRLNKGKAKREGHIIQLEEAGVTAETFNSFSFNTLILTKQQMMTIGVFVIYHFHDDADGFIHTEQDKVTLRNFVTEAEKQYMLPDGKKNPFHNFQHATDVLHGVSKMMRLTQSENFLTELEQFSLLVAALGHDIGHPGVNNGFLSEVGHELALQYNDLSPLENMHVSKLYFLVSNQETNVFCMLSKEQYKEVRKYCIETILHTDMMGHQAMVKDLQMLFQVNAEIFTQPGNTIGAQTEVLSQQEHKMLVMDNLLHSADVSNPCRSWAVSEAWAHCVLDEFFAQGDQEKMLGVPVQFLNDRDKLNRPNSQIGFLEFMIAPYYAAQIRLFHNLHEYGDNLAHNLGNWEELWATEVKPDPEARSKVTARVQKVQSNMEEAKQSSARDIEVKIH